MSEIKKKNYIKGSVREAAFSRGNGDILNIDLFVPDLDKIANDSGYAKVTVYRRREIDEYGNTHYMFQNEFVADKSKAKPKDESETNDSEPQGSSSGESMPWEK